MGKGLGFHCKKCHYEYEVRTGIGMRFPIAYREALKSIAAGDYGIELQKLFNANPLAAINGEGIVYICRACGKWEEGLDPTLYVPDDPEQILNQQFGEKTVREWGYVPYVMDYDLQEQYHVIKRIYHKCSHCGKRMHKATNAELETLPCPKCGEPNRATDFICWD